MKASSKLTKKEQPKSENANGKDIANNEQEVEKPPQKSQQDREKA